jgi:hypothetical protein
MKARGPFFWTATACSTRPRPRRRPYPPGNVGYRKREFFPASLKRWLVLKKLGFLLIVVTNQPDVARGAADPPGRSHQPGILSDRLPLDEFRVCPHDNADACDCRKPRPGLLLAAAESHTASICPPALWSAIAPAIVWPAPRPVAVTILIARPTARRTPAGLCGGRSAEAAAIIAKLAGGAKPIRSETRFAQR